MGIALLKGAHSYYQRRRKTAILNDSYVITEIFEFDLEAFKISRFQPTHNYDAAYEKFEGMCTGLNDKKLNQELNALKAGLKRIAEKAKETTDSESAPESEYYKEYIVYTFDSYTPPLLPRYRKVDEDVKAWEKLFTSFKTNSKRYTNKVKTLA